MTLVHLIENDTDLSRCAIYYWALGKQGAVRKMLRVDIILGSTSPGRNGETVAKWVYEVAKTH